MQAALQCIPAFATEEPFSHSSATSEKEYRVITRVKNNLLMGAIERAGYSSLSNFADKTQISLSMLCAIINFKVSPLDKNGDWRSIVHTICTALNKMPSQLFTEAQTKITGAKVKVTEVSEAEAIWALEHASDHDPQRQLEARDLHAALDNLMDALRPREQEVLRMRYGFDGQEMTFRDIADKLGITGARVIQIHDRAVRILQHPKHRGPCQELKFQLKG